MSKALFPGTFDPFTIGHQAIVKRTLTFMDEVVIAIVNNPDKHALFSVEERVRMISGLYENEPRVSVVAFAGATPDIALEVGANAIVRGVRSVKDFEYEENLAFIYKKMCGIETILLYTDPELACVSSSIVREMIKYGKDPKDFVPFPLTMNNE
ncbi:MAG: pantetheine-phosphate adenylyltransferase [Bacteroidaceae bacterium]|jgi:pantetheine-phosphate adenylyltransferase|nr:pantetheine-phosphate adenylyltransferase [Bacteroidaceae bacterium]